MAKTEKRTVGKVASLWRYPVKSMQGEQLDAVHVTERGVLGDRAFAIVEQTERKIASAKNPRRWPKMFEFGATFIDPPQVGGPAVPVRITLPDGRTITSDQEDADAILSELLGESVALESETQQEPMLEEYWPEIEAFENRGQVTDEPIHPNSFFDGAPIHLLTTATLDRLQQVYPDGRFETKRFRPNIVIATPPGVEGYAENEWFGRVLAIGDQVRLHIDRPCPRCVMTTLAQEDLPRDVGILRATVQANEGNLGAYVSVRRGGQIRTGDAVWIEE